MGIAQKVADATIGASGIGAVELVNSGISADLSAVHDATGIIVQIVIGIVTLLGLFRKKRV